MSDHEKRIEFAQTHRIQTGRPPRNMWFWRILSHCHVYAESAESFVTLEEAVQDFWQHGYKRLAEVAPSSASSEPPTIATEVEALRQHVRDQAALIDALQQKYTDEEGATDE